MEDIQNTDNQADQVIEECLSNPVVLRRILEHFTNTELLHKISFVNKLWNYEARSVLSKRGDLIARFRHNCRNSYENFRAFATDLRRMNISPFSGIHMNLRCDYGFERVSCPDPVGLNPDLYEAIFDKMTYKQISIEMENMLWNSRSCNGFMLMTQILYHHGKTIETLSLDHIFKENSFWLLQHCNFPRLKTLKLDNQHWITPRGDRLCQPFTNIINAILPKAPNLQVIHCGGDIIQLEKLLQGTSLVLVYNDEVTAPFHEIPDSMIGTLRLKNIKLSYSDPEFNLDKFSRITPMLLQASTTTLCEVRMDAILAVPLMCYGVCLKNVKDLIMWIAYDKLELIEPRLLNILKDFDFTQIFPSLDKVLINRGSGFNSHTTEHMSKIVEEASGVLGKTQPHRAVNIKQLNVDSPLSNHTAQFLAEMFPSISKLEVGAVGHGEVAFGSIWKYWRDLETLEVRVDIVGNLDSIFCGIFPEEVAELRQKDDEYLKRVNIVPVMPAITCMRNLKTFTFKIFGIQDPAFQFSKVTGLIAFTRCPTLTVNLSTFYEDVYRALRDMEPYATFIHKGLRRTLAGWRVTGNTNKSITS